MRRSGAHKSLGAPWTSMFKMEKGNYVQSFYYYNFIHTILCKLVGSTTSAQFTTAERQDCALKQWSKTHLTLRQSSSTIPKTSGCANVASNSREGMRLGWRTPRLTVWSVLNYTRIETVHKVRKKTFVFYYEAVICTNNGGQIQACGPLWSIRLNCQLTNSKWCTYCKYRFADVLAHTQSCHIKKWNGKLVMHQIVS